MVQDLSERLADPLVAAAAQGDLEAAGEYFQQHLGVLMPLARRIAGNVLDPEDLLSEAITRLLEKWARTTGPTENVVGYLAATMRNRVKDELKSPRSKVRRLDDADDIEDPSEPGQSLIEVRREVDMVRSALGTLPVDQQDVLIAMSALGEKPRDLEARFNRPASAISSLHSRAKQGLRRAVFRLVLEDGAPRECVDAIKRVPVRVADSPRLDGEEPDAHFQQCKRCRAAWHQFGQLATAFGVLPLVTIAFTFVHQPAVAAAEPLNRDAETRPYAAPTSGYAGVTGRQRANRGPDSTQKEGLRRRRLILRRSSARAAWLLCTLGIILLICGAFALAAQPSKPEADFAVTSIEERDGLEVFRVDIEIDDSGWRVGSLLMNFDRQVDTVEAPAGWVCETEGGIVRCGTRNSSPSGGNFVVHGVDLQLREHVEFQVLADTESGFRVRGVVKLRQLG